jgi:hypothetical protein
MKEVTDKNFGVVIALWLPGVILLWGLTYSYPHLSTWLNKANSSEAATIGGFLYLSLAALAAGMVVSAIRWMIIDLFVLSYIPWIKVQRETFDFGTLRDKDSFAVFQGAVENFYRYYQYYSNTLVSILGALFVYVIRGEERIGRGGWCAVAFICIALLLASRDSLKNYYACRAQIARGKSKESGG